MYILNCGHFTPLPSLIESFLLPPKPPPLSCICVCDPLSLIRVLEGTWVRGYFLEHGQLIGGYATKESDTPPPAAIASSPSGARDDSGLRPRHCSSLGPETLNSHIKWLTTASNCNSSSRRIQLLWPLCAPALMFTHLRVI